MHLHYDNVNDAFNGLVVGFLNRKFNDFNPMYGGPHVPPMSTTPTRNGTAIRIDEPVTITYRYPRQRVLFNSARDANPFFHMVEALWMLAGQNHIAPLLYYNKEVASFSDDGKTWHGAYGYRWRHFFGFDQIEAAIKILRRDSGTRRVVIDHWDGSDLSLVLAKPDCKDVPCNTTIMLQLRPTNVIETNNDGTFKVIQNGSGKALDMTITNRSNDLVWGALGSNYVHFTMLQEYIACALGVDVGVYHQISNNLHCYVGGDQKVMKSNLLTPDWLEPNFQGWYTAVQCPDETAVSGYSGAGYFPQRIFPGIGPEKTSQSLFDSDLQRMFDVPAEYMHHLAFQTPFMVETVRPMLSAWHHHKKRDYTMALNMIARCSSEDWKLAGKSWLLRRQSRYERTKDDGVLP